ncbi:MAG: PQQ-dependent sugar dehydrogenase [Acidimicrobiia bacterium]|nr:PQQ-dependent sugar dehydrogenase [Acidimicrobiia bacterium]
MVVAVAVLAVVLAAAAVLLTDRAASAHVNSDDFVDELRVGGMTRVVAVEWLTGGEALVLNQDGTLWKVNPSTGAKSVYLTLPNIDSSGERGSLDLVRDTNNDVYVYFTSTNSNLNVGRFRYTGAGSGDLGSFTTLWSKPNTSPNTNHVGGSIDIGPDGRLYVTIGDAVQSENSQQLTNVFGKVLRINKNGTIPTDNPFFDGSGPNADEIYAYGLRNPWRASFDDATGTFWIGDVGGNDAPTAYEEVNILQRGANYGWANCQGPLGPPKVGPDCPAGTTAPVHYYLHDAGGGCCQNAAVTGGEVMRGSTLPPDLRGAYIFGDFSIGEIRYLELGSGNTVLHDGVVSDANFPVWVGQGPDGHIYYLVYGYSGPNGQLRRLRYTPGAGQPPVINSASATPTSGQAPLTVRFSASASDPDGDAVSYRWDFGDGISSSQRNPTHIYGATGAYQARLTVTAGGDTTIGNEIAISVGNAPDARIVTPADGSLFAAGDEIRLEGRATDDGPIVGRDYRWDVWLRHGNHQHPVLSNQIGRVKTLNVPTTGHGWEGDTSYLIQLTVTDNSGLVDVETVEIEPDKVAVRLRSEAGFGVNVDGVALLTPHNLDTIKGFQHTISTDTDVCVKGRRWIFDDWSDGRTAASRTFRVPGRSTTLTARFTDIGPCVAECLGVPATVVIGAGDRPTNGDDVILGTAEKDVILAGGGNDLVCGGGGGDRIEGEAGDDWLFGEGGGDTLKGGIGRDVIDGGPGADQLLGNDGNDVLLARGGNDTGNGGPGADRIEGKGGDDQLRGGIGDDVIIGHEGRDELFGGGNQDRLDGGEGADLISGSNGKDELFGGAGDDRLFGSQGRDVLWGDGGNDRLAGEGENDRLRGGANVDHCFGGDGIDGMRSCEFHRGVP